MALKKPFLKLVRIHGVRIEYIVSPKWCDKHRLKLKQALNEILPYKPHRFVSVSHTHHLGGFALSTKPLGFDLEPAKRIVSTRATKRFATPQEIIGFHNNALAVWVAKEAAFKALRGINQPRTITAVRIEQPRFIKKNNGNEIFVFRFKLNNFSPLAGYGVGRCEISHRTIMGFAVFSP